MWITTALCGETGMMEMIQIQKQRQLQASASKLSVVTKDKNWVQQ